MENLWKRFVRLFTFFNYFLKDKFSEYNLNKSISACIVAQQRTSENFELEKSKKYCEERVRKQKEAY